MLIAEVMGEEERVTNILASTKRHISVSEIKVTMSIFRTVCSKGERQKDNKSITP